MFCPLSMYNVAVGGVQFGRRGCSTSAALLFHLSVSTVQFETVRVFNGSAIFKNNISKEKGLIRTMKISLIIPMFNEAEIIENTVSTVYSFLLEKYKNDDFEVLLVDDGSTDSTGEIAKRLSSELTGVKTISIRQNRGKGAAIRSGVLVAQGDFVLFTDCDLAYGIEVIDAFYEKFLSSNADVVIGSRTMENNGYARYPKLRKIMSKAYIWIIRKYTELEYSDFQCGIKGFSKSIAKQIFSKSKIDGWNFDLEVLLICKNNSFVVEQVPVVILKHQMTRINILTDSIHMLFELRKIKREI